VVVAATVNILDHMWRFLADVVLPPWEVGGWMAENRPDPTRLPPPGWRFHTYPETPPFLVVHAVPVNDWVKHDARDCVCGPRRFLVERDETMSTWLVCHEALDGRR
jgi:hypothetical protein